MWALFRALRRGWNIETLHELTKIDRWFLQQFAEINELRNMAALGEFRDMSPDLLRTLKRNGFADADIAAVYDLVQQDLRSQYLLAYQSANTTSGSDQFRQVEVKVDRPRSSVRTLSGYYP